MFVGLLLFVAIIVIAFWLIAIYNRLVAAKHAVAQGWANIDVLLRQRHDELPKLVGTCKQYMEYEKDAFDRVLQARSAVMGARGSLDMPALGKAESDLRGQLGKLFALAESYPDLKSNQSFTQLQHRISGLETGISDRRELYNDAVNQNNVAVEQFPGSIVAGLGGFRSFDLLQFDGGTTADVDVKALFNAELERSMAIGIVVFVLGFTLVVACLMAFNHLVMLKHNVAKAWANIDVLLRQRHDELRKLVTVCAQSMPHERALIERVAEARTRLAAAQHRADAGEVGPLDKALRADVVRLFALAEDYPELKANEHLLHVQERIAVLETAIADRREFFNATVTINNVQIGEFPYSILASLSGMRAFALFAREEPQGGPMRGRGRDA